MDETIKSEQESCRDQNEDSDNVEYIAVIEASNGGRYAYYKPESPSEHKLGEEVNTDCNPRNPDSEFVLRRYSWAQRRWLSPCQLCGWDVE